MVDDRDAFFMRKALRLAERGRGRTSPNPMVGAVIVDDEGVIVGRGSHEMAGGPHAEIHALAGAGARARGATLYCTLEPCSHVGRTGPCAPRVAEAGIRRAVIAVGDPNPLVAGRGIDLLRRCGIEVRSGVLEQEAKRLNLPFFSVMQRRRPFVTLKVALSLDGFMSAAPGERTAITGAAANREVHRERAEVDALAIGSGTLLADDPMLTSRVAYRARPLARVIFDTRLRTPPSARLFSTLDAGPVIIVSTPEAVEANHQATLALRTAGATVEAVEEGPLRLPMALERLAGMGLTSLIVEGGAELHRAFWDAGLVDRVQIYVAPRVLGRGVAWLPEPIVSSPRMGERTVRPLGEDVLVEAYVHRID